MFSFKRYNFAVLLFFLVSMFYVWLPVGGSGCERGKAGLWGDKTVGLKILRKTCRLGDLVFFSLPVLKGTDRERLGLTQGNGGQRLCPTHTSALAQLAQCPFKSLLLLGQMRPWDQEHRPSGLEVFLLTFHLCRPWTPSTAPFWPWLNLPGFESQIIWKAFLNNSTTNILGQKILCLGGCYRLNSVPLKLC